MKTIRRIEKTVENGQIVRIEFEEETPEQQNTIDDGFMDKMFESVGRTNQFSHAVRQALINESQDDFKKLYIDYKEHSKKERKEDGKDEESEKEQRINIIKVIASELVEFTYDKEFKEKKALSYLNTLDEEISPRILAFIFNACGRKDAAFSILEQHPSDITNEQYDAFYEVLRIDIYLRNKPLSSKEAEDIYNERKSEFLVAQSKLALHKELQELPSKESKNKRAKI